MTTTDRQIDPRGPRLGAFVPLTLSIVALVLGPGVGAIVIFAILVVLFLPGAIVGPQATAQGWVFRTFIRPRLGPPTETESFRPPRFAQQVGLAFSTAALVFAIADVSVGFFVFAGFLTFAAFLQGVFDFCLGCEMYLLFKRATTKTA
jgi:hypothetical protein